jgi:hypothetical protein
VDPVAGEHAVGGPHVLDLRHHALVGHVGLLARLGDDAVEPGALEAHEPLARERLVARDGGEVDRRPRVRPRHPPSADAARRTAAPSGPRRPARAGRTPRSARASRRPAGRRGWRRGGGAAARRRSRAARQHRARRSRRRPRTGRQALQRRRDHLGK